MPALTAAAPCGPVFTARAECADPLTLQRADQQVAAVAAAVGPKGLWVVLIGRDCSINSFQVDVSETAGGRREGRETYGQAALRRLRFPRYTFWKLVWSSLLAVGKQGACMLGVLRPVCGSCRSLPRGWRVHWPFLCR